MAKKDKSGKNGGSQPTGPAPYWDGTQWVLPQQQPVAPPPPPTGPAPYWDGEKWVMPQPGQQAAPAPQPAPEPVAAAQPEPEPEPVAAPAAPAAHAPVAQAAPKPVAPEREVVFVPAKSKGIKGLVAILVLQCVILLAGLTTLALVLFNVQVPIPEVGAIGGAAPQEVSLQAAASVGTAPFLEQPFGSSIDEQVAQPALVPAPEDGVTLTVQPVVADAPFLYGVNDTDADQWCDRDGMGEALASDADRAALWAEALSSDSTLDIGDDALTADALAASVANLGRVVLAHDTRVTLHTLTDDGVQPVQSVLQKGSWVLVDRVGVPRVTCNGSHPLTAPVALDGPAKFSGAAWPDLDPAELVEVVAAEFQVSTFNVRIPASEEGVFGVQNTPWYEAPAAPTGGFDCKPGLNENSGGGPVESFAITNDGDAPVVLYIIDPPQNGACPVVHQSVLTPGNGMMYPLASDTTKWVPWVNVGFLATSLDGEVVWSQHVAPAEKGTAVTWSIP